jgi:hypothetical protein
MSASYAAIAAIAGLPSSHSGRRGVHGVHGDGILGESLGSKPGKTSRLGFIHPGMTFTRSILDGYLNLS